MQETEKQISTQLSSTLSNLRKSIKEQVQKQKEFQDKYLKENQSLMKQSFKEIFLAYPWIKAITWKQYTPYFNDGDECVFNRYDFTFTNDPTGETDDYEDEKDGFWAVESPSSHCMESLHDYWKKKISEIGKDNFLILSGLNQLLEGIDDDIYQNTFGDHVKVVATENGFEVNDYDHD